MACKKLKSITVAEPTASVKEFFEWHRRMVMEQWFSELTRHIAWLKKTNARLARNERRRENAKNKRKS